MHIQGDRSAPVHCGSCIVIKEERTIPQRRRALEAGGSEVELWLTCASLQRYICTSCCPEPPTTQRHLLLSMDKDIKRKKKFMKIHRRRCFVVVAASSPADVTMFYSGAVKISPVWASILNTPLSRLFEALGSATAELSSAWQKVKAVNQCVVTTTTGEKRENGIPTV